MEAGKVIHSLLLSSWERLRLWFWKFSP
jgi:hypothetical protein